MSSMCFICFSVLVSLLVPDSVQAEQQQEVPSSSLAASGVLVIPALSQSSPETGTFSSYFKVFAHCMLLVQKLPPSRAYSNCSSFQGAITTEGEKKKKEKKTSTIFYTVEDCINKPLSRDKFFGVFYALK